MEPLKLTVQGIRPWKSDRLTTIAFLAGEPASADDDPADHASIHQAIADAVHGQTPCSDRHTLMNEDARHMSVSLIFWAHDGAWHVRRRARRLPDGTVVDAGCRLKRFGGKTMRACMVAVNREMAAERRDADMLAAALAFAAALDTADRWQMLTALVERREALRKTMARKQAAIERLLNALLELRRG